MSIASVVSKIFSNKYTLYIVAFLSATNVLGYLVMHNINAVVFFALVSVMTYQFSKNMAIVLLVAMVATNFLMVNRMREGLENSGGKNAPAVNNIGDKDAQIANAMPAVKNAKTNNDLKNPATTDATTTSNVDVVKPISDVNNSDKNIPTDQSTAPVGAGQSIKNNKEQFRPRLDYAATIEQSYANLDQLLGNDSIKQLTTDTQKLMQQQQTLFNTMNQMVPVLEGAQNMLKGLNMETFTNSLNGLAKAK
jgi:hypothetical protein